MSKLKLSFAFVLMLFLVGMYSAVAFAAGSTAKSPDTGANTYGTDIQAGLAPDAQTNDNTYSVDPTDPNSKSNANQTGLNVGGTSNKFSDVIKSDDMVKNADGSHGTQRTHGEYMNNTNSCASCHQTHTGAAGSLLFKDGKYQTCTACHDGTLGFYNVFSTDTSKADGSGFDNSAGTFGGSTAGNMSVHLANGAVSINAAPGGNRNDTTGNWSEEFTCASCHAPHGSFSDRLLNENPNEMANTPIAQGGQQVSGVPVVDKTTVVDSGLGTTFALNTKVPTADFTVDYSGKDANADPSKNPVASKTYNFVVYRFILGDSGTPTNKKQVYNAGTKKWVDSSDPNDDYYTQAGLATGDTVLQLMQWDGSKYVIDRDPWIHDYDFDAGHNKHYWTAFKNGSGSEVFDTDQLKKGEVLGAGFAGVVTHDTTNFPNVASEVTVVNSLVSGKIARGYVVKLDINASPDSTLAANNVKVTNVASLWASKNADGTVNTAYVSNRGVAMSAFCAACHTDYLASSSQTNQSGTFDHAYRHTTTSDSYTCIRCHFAHGTDVTVMRDARGKTYDQILTDTTDYPFTGAADRTAAVKDYLLDKNPSSALKRYTNMAVCWACHTSSHSGGTRNTDSYKYNPQAGINTDRNGIEFDY